DPYVRSVSELLDARDRPDAARRRAAGRIRRPAGPEKKARMKKPVVIGIGNSLRRDDGIGCRAARLVEESLAPESAVVIECHQVTPELAAKLAGAPLVVFLDAAVNDVPGRVCSRPVEPDNPGPWSHYLSPGQLLGLAQYINATTPAAVLITGGV